MKQGLQPPEGACQAGPVRKPSKLESRSLKAAGFKAGLTCSSVWGYRGQTAQELASQKLRTQKYDLQPGARTCFPWERREAEDLPATCFAWSRSRHAQFGPRHSVLPEGMQLKLPFGCTYGLPRLGPWPGLLRRPMRICARMHVIDRLGAWKEEMGFRS